MSDTMTCLLWVATLTLAGALTAAEGPRLAPATDLPEPRAAHSATLLGDGQVLVAGGCVAHGCEEGLARDSYLFDPERGRFLPGGAMLQPRAGHRAVALPDGSVLAIGGWTASGVTDAIERYDPRQRRWQAYGRLRQARDGFTATLLPDGGILVAGGYAEGMRRLDSVERFDPVTRRSVALPPLAQARAMHTATLLADGRVLVAGGSGSRSSVLASLELFDPATSRFRPAGSLQRARHKHAAVRVGDDVLILGGAGIPEDAGHFADSERWAAASGRVLPGPRMGEGRYKFADGVLVLDDGRVLVSGGGRQAEVSNAMVRAFLPVASGPGDKLAFSTATRLADGRVWVAGGYDPSIRVSRRAWLFTP